MRVLYLHQYFVEPSRSGGTRSYEFARRLVRDGHKVTVLTSTAMLGDDRRTGASIERFDVDGIDVVAVDVAYSNAMGTLRRLRAFLSFALRSVVVALRAERPDVIVATSTPLTIIVPAALAKWRHRAPLVFEVRDLWPAVPIAMGYLRSRPLRAVAHGLERFAYRIAEEVIALSPGMASGVTAVAGDDTPVTLVPNSCDLDLFSPPDDAEPGPPPPGWPRAEGDDAPIAVYAGTLGRANDVGWLIDVAAAMPADSRWRFVIVGDGAERDEIERRARSMPPPSPVRVLDPVPKSSMPAILAGSDLVLSLFAPVTILETTSPNKFFDGLAAGRPVAVNYGGWQAELIAGHRCGLVLDRDPRRAAQQLSTFEESTADARAEMGRRSRQLAEDEFSRDDLYGRWSEVVRRVASRRSG